jgi:hypothetical protein
MIPRYVYDLEVFPNLFCVTFLDINTQEKNVFLIYDTVNDGEKLLEFLKREMLLYGYNNIMFDGVVLEHVIENYWDLDILKETFKLSSSLISDRSAFGRKKKSNAEYPFKQIDLMKIMAFDKLGVSLKQCAINLKWHRIMDLPFEPTHKIKEDEVSVVIDYNLNDVLITEKLYNEMLPVIQLRERLSELFGVDMSSASDSKMANLILEDFYSKQAGADINKIRTLRTVRYQLMLSECFGKNIEFLTNKLTRIKNEIGNTIVRENNEFKYSKKVNFGGIDYEMGVGGLHSDDCDGIFETDKDFIIRDADVASYYPNIMIQNNIVPEHLGLDFIDVLKKITKERLSAKKTDKVKAEALKITINSIFGKLGSNTFWLYDPKAFLSVTVSGQLYLLMLIESLVLAGIPVISANTDGIVCKIPRGMEEYYKKVCEWWQEKTGFSLEFTDYELYVRSDVNNYVTKKSDGKIKTKGRYLTELDVDEYKRTFLKKGYKYPIVPRALFNYFVKGIIVEKTITSSNDIMDFCISQKTGSDFVLEYQVNGSITKLQKNNRFFISKTGGKLIKRHLEKGNTIGLYVEKNTKILNDYDSSIPFSSYDIDYMFYIEEVNKYIEPVEKSRYEKQDYSFVDESPDYTPQQAISPNEEAIRLKLEGIKNLSTKTVSALVALEDNFEGTDFFAFLLYAENNGFISKKFEDLIKIGYFSKFGKNKKLLTFFQEFYSGKSKYKASLSDKTKHGRLVILQYVWDKIPDTSLSVKEQIDAELGILGKIISSFVVNPRYAYVVDINTKFSPRLQLYSLGTGTQKEVKIQKRYYDISPIHKGDIIYAQAFEKKIAVKHTDAGFEEDPTKPPVFWLTSFRHVKNYSEMDAK